MHASIAKKLAKKMKRQSGFTLLEILVVLTIMGFLIAMVAPRLAGISGGAVDTVCDSNQQRQIQMTAAYFEKTGKFPDKLTNLVIETDAYTYALPSVSNGNPDDGAEVLAEEFVDRVKPVLHYLTESEIKALRDIGVTRVFNLNNYEGTDTASITAAQSAMREIPLAWDATNRIAVMMSGIGVNAATGDTFNMVDGTTVMAVAPGEELINYGEAHFLGRIIMGFGPENGLVTSGLVSNAAHCPGGIQDADNVIYNDYNIVLPRLAATVNRATVAAFGDAAADIKGFQYTAFGYAEDFDTTGPITATVGADGAISAISDSNVKVRVQSFTEQPSYQYATMCPEGHMFPADDSDLWAISFGDTPSVTINN